MFMKIELIMHNIRIIIFRLFQVLENYILLRNCIADSDRFKYPRNTKLAPSKFKPVNEEKLI